MNKRIISFLLTMHKYNTCFLFPAPLNKSNWFVEFSNVLWPCLKIDYLYSLYFSNYIPFTKTTTWKFSLRNASSFELIFKYKIWWTKIFLYWIINFNICNLKITVNLKFIWYFLFTFILTKAWLQRQQLMG